MHCMVPGDAKDRLAQLRKGTLQYCVLAALREDERYAFDLVRSLGETPGIVVSEGTVYPLLSRLRRSGLVETTWRESTTGPPRRYYRLTPEGRAALESFTDEWRAFRATVDDVLGVRD